MPSTRRHAHQLWRALTSFQIAAARARISFEELLMGVSFKKNCPQMGSSAIAKSLWSLSK
jgi:hypothetical protein